MRRALFAFLFSLLISNAVMACPVLQKADPKVGSTVNAPVKKVSLHFSGKVDAVKSELSVTDAKGRDMANGKITGEGNPTDTIVAPVKILAPGTYKVKWHIYCNCEDNKGSMFPGSYSFIVQ